MNLHRRAVRRKPTMSVPFTLLVTLSSTAESLVEAADAGARLRDRTVDELRAELRRCQQRLGTPAESAGDFERARALAHELNNRATIAYLRAALGSDPVRIDRLVA